eukprot:scaffold75373_cov22-Tisochrysis_lutea.AAC.1
MAVSSTPLILFLPLPFHTQWLLGSSPAKKNLRFRRACVSASHGVPLAGSRQWGVPGHHVTVQAAAWRLACECGLRVAAPWELACMFHWGERNERFAAQRLAYA